MKSVPAESYFAAAHYFINLSIKHTVYPVSCDACKIQFIDNTIDHFHSMEHIANVHGVSLEDMYTTIAVCNDFIRDAGFYFYMLLNPQYKEVNKKVYLEYLLQSK